MDQSKALHNLSEVADLIGMLEDLTSNGSPEKMSPASWAGLKITLKNVRSNIISSRDVLASEMVQKSKANYSIEQRQSMQKETSVESAAQNLEPNASEISEEAPRLQVRRTDLRTSLERLVDR